MTISLKRPITRLIKTDAIMISEAMPTFLDKEGVMEVQYQKVAEKAKGYQFKKVRIHRWKSRNRVILNQFISRRRRSDLDP